MLRHRRHLRLHRLDPVRPCGSFASRRSGGSGVGSRYHSRRCWPCRPVRHLQCRALPGCDTSLQPAAEPAAGTRSAAPNRRPAVCAASTSATNVRLRSLAHAHPRPQHQLTAVGVHHRLRVVRLAVLMAPALAHQIRHCPQSVEVDLRLRLRRCRRPAVRCRPLRDRRTPRPRRHLALVLDARSKSARACARRSNSAHGARSSFARNLSRRDNSSGRPCGSGASSVSACAA